MATSFTPDALRGLMVPDPRIDVSRTGTGSSYTQAEPNCGVPVPSASSALVLETSGKQSLGLTVDVQTTRAGGAVTTDSVRAGGFVWREDGGAWQGWDGPLGYAGFGTVHTWGFGAGSNLYTYPHVLYTSVGTRLVVAQRLPSGGSVRTLAVMRRAQDGSTSTVNIVTNSVTAQSMHACLVAIPDGRVVLLVAYADLASVGLQVRAYMTTDDGVSWTMQTDAALPAYIDTSVTEVRRLRAAYYGGQVLMMLAIREPAATVPDSFRQYASIDQGMSFALVEAVSGADANSVHTGGVHDIYTLPDVGFGVVYCGSSRAEWGANSETLAKRLGSAFSRWSDVDPVEVGLLAPAGTLSVGNQLSDDTELAAAVDDDGQVYALAPNTGNSSRVRPARSSDGVTWSVLGQAGNLVHSVDYAGERIESMTCAWYAGALHVIHGVDSTTVYDAQLGDTVLSGYTAATLPMLPAVQSGGDYSAGSYMTWEPWWAPDTIGWTITTVGAPTTTLTGGAMQITAGLAEVRRYTHARSVALTAANTVQALFEVDCDSGTASDVDLETSTGTSSYGLRVRVTTTQVVCVDLKSGATLMTYNRTAAEYVHVRAWASNLGGTGRATVWVDEVDGPYGIARGYVRILDTTLTNGGAAAASQSVKIGQTGQGVSNWRYCAVQYSAQMSSPHSLNIPTDVNGRDYSGRSLTLSQGLKVRAVGGPSALADTWSIAARYGHGVEALASSSPSVTWRSSDTSSAQVFVWETDADPANVSPLMGPLGALYIGNANFRTATLEGRNAFGAWVAIGTWDASAGQAGLAWSRRGDVVYPSLSNASAGVYWYPHGTLDGARFAFDTAAGPVVPIRYQAEGAWTREATKHTRISVYGDLSAVGISGTAGAVLATSGLLVWNNDPMYSAYRLTIPVQQVAEAYYEAGVVRIGHLAAFGRRYSWGRNLASEMNTELRTGSNGRRTSKVLGPSRRSVEFGWTDAADQSAFGVDMTTDRPDYFFGSSTGTPEPTAAKMDGPALMRGIVEHLNGSAEPVVYVAYLPRVALGSTSMVVHPDLHLYGRVVSDVSIETVQGKEWGGTGATGEMVRTSSIRLEEEL